MDDKLKGTIKRIVQLTQQNPEFGDELREALKIESSANSVLYKDKKIDEIYELCIEKILFEQATAFYANFPLKSIIPTLIKDFVRMESFRREDNFGDFCLALYQQIEGITNLICNQPVLNNIAEKMWTCPAYVNSENNKQPKIEDRLTGTPNKQPYQIASLIFPGTNKKTSMPHAIEKSKQSIQTLQALDKSRVVLYFVGYKAMMRNSDYDNFKEMSSCIGGIYQCRNLNHRGSALTEWQEKIINEILPLKSFYYCKYLGVLSQYILYVKEGYSSLRSTKEYADKLEKSTIKLDGPKVLGKIDVSKDIL